MTEGPILLVEDDPSLAAIVARYLVAHGHHVEVSTTAEDAIARLPELRPAMVVLDINLPGETGWEVARSSAVAEAGSPPIVVASATRVSPSRLREYGIAGYLSKPFPLETLVQIVERTVAGSVHTDG
jgi:DNA-binding response OmpR family regulator